MFDFTHGITNSNFSSTNVFILPAVQSGKLQLITDAMVRGKGHMDRPNDTQQWGDYAAAIARWEHVIGRPAPAPTTRDWDRFNARK